MEMEMEMETDYNSFISNITDEMRKSDECYSLKVERSDINMVDLAEENDDDKKLSWKKIKMSFLDDGDIQEESNDDKHVSQKKYDNEKLKPKMMGMSLEDVVDLTDGNYDGENLKQSKIAMRCADAVSSDVSDNMRSSVSQSITDSVVKSSENSDASKKCSTEDEEEIMIVDASVMKEEVSSHKRKRHCLSEMLHWMATVALDPTDPEIGEIPESSRWMSYVNDNYWKQVLLAREALFLKRAHRITPELSVWQKKQRMHPSMFDDQIGSEETLRFSPRLLFAKIPKTPSLGSFETDANSGRPKQRIEARHDMQPSASIYTSRPVQRIPAGRAFQADVPEWTGVASESDSKWLGTRVWPSGRTENNCVIERDPIGKGRVDTCGCEIPGSTSCVKFHVAERRKKMKVELGSVFYCWNFDKMGEECSVSWTAIEEKKFEAVVKENPLSLQKCFWDQMCKALPRKSWNDLVSYYFNVFVLRRRGEQNRHAPSNIDSDDDEAECGSTTDGFGRETAKSCISVNSQKK